MQKSLRIFLFIIFAALTGTHGVLAQWKQVAEVVLRINVIAIAENGTMYAGTSGSSGLNAQGVFRSTDNGDSWTAQNAGLPLISGLYPVASSIIAHNDTVLLCANGKLYRSINGGSWTAYGTGMPAVNTIVETPNAMFAENGSYLYRSKDRGATWSPSDTVSPSVGTILYNNGVVFTGSYRSTNNGDTWVERSNVNVNGSQYPIVNPAVWNGDTLYGGSYVGPCRSTNNGLTWAWYGNFAGTSPNSAGMRIAGRKTFAFTLSGGGTKVWRSDDITTIAWSVLDNDLPGDADRACWGFLYHNGVIWIGMGHYGIYRSDDGGDHWRTANVGFGGYGSTSGLTTNGHTALSCGGSTIISRSTDEGATWIESSRGFNGYSSSAIILRDSIAFASTSSGYYIFKSTDEGMTWKSSGTGAGGSPKGFGFVGSGTDTVLAASSSGIYRSTDKGLHWAESNTGVTLPPNGIFLSAGGAVFAAANNTTGNGQLCKSTDGGATWSQVGADSVNQTITGMCTLGNSIIVTTGWNWAAGRIWRSDDNGGTWYRIMNGLPASGFTSGIVNANGTLLAACTLILGTRYMYASTDGGSSWELANDGLPSGYMGVQSMAATDHNVLLALNGSGAFGIYRRAKTDFVTGVTESGAQVPRNFILEQNYPNPFNPTTTVGYALAKGSVVNLDVYDLLGRKVASLAEGFKPAGSYQATLDAANLSSGLYLYRLKTASGVLARKLMVVK